MISKRAAMMVTTVALLFAGAIGVAYLLAAIERDKYAQREAPVIRQIKNLKPIVVRDVAFFPVFGRRDVIKKYENALAVRINAWQVANGFRRDSMTTLYDYGSYMDTLSVTVTTKD